MTRETNVIDVDDASRALPRQHETPMRIRHGGTNYLHDGEDDDNESDGDFELETMEDDDEDDEDDDEEDDDGDEAFDDDDEANVEDVLCPDEDMDTIDDELMALVAGATTGSGTRDDSSDCDDRIAHRTRTKLSLVDVEIDLLESLLPPDPVETSRLFGNDGHEYQRFLSSLLPRVDEEDNLSFLDEEDEEYHPEEDEDDDDDMDDDDEMLTMTTAAVAASKRDADGAGCTSNRAKDNALHYQSVRVSKKELTELLWDSTQLTQPLKVPPTFPKTSVVRPRAANRVATTEGAGDATSAETVEELKDAAALKEMKGTISQEQCIQLASQMHKHFQLLLQSYYLITTELNSSSSTSATRRHKSDRSGDQDLSAVVNIAAKATAQDQLEECESMLRELQIRGKHALKHKAQLLSKLTLNSSSSCGNGSSATGGRAVATEDLLEKRRVTRSITAAHAAVAHPSMFDIVGSQSIDQLKATFRHGCSISERNQRLRSSMVELDKHLLLNRKKNKRTRTTGMRKIVFSAAEDRLLLRGVKRHGVINAEAWREIRETLIPTKEESEIAKRYRYLCSRKKRGGGGAATAFKEYHSEHHKRKWAKWMIEEDVRVARGVVEYFGDNRRYARISSKYLPHRHRLEIRKRWERLKKRYGAEAGCVETPLVAATSERDDDDIGESHEETYEQQIEVGDGEERGDDRLAKNVAARAFAMAVKRFLEMKLRESVKKMQQQQLVLGPASVAQAPMSKTPRGTKTKTISKSTSTLVATTAATPKPRVTGNSDAQTTPPRQPTEATLEAIGCSRQHLHPALFFSSWAVINPAMLLQHTCAHNWPAFIDNKRQDITSESTLDMVSRAAVSRVEEETAAHRAHWASQQQLHSIEEEKDEGNQGQVSDDVADFSLDAFNSEEEDEDEDEDEEDSDFERDELLSSEEEDEDSGSEYEQLELYDDEDDTGDDGDDGDDDDGDERTGRLEPVQPTLHLNNLRQPGNNLRTMRALEALERRITGNTQAQIGTADGFGAAISSSAPRVALVDGDSGAAETFSEDVVFDDGGDLDLFAYEVLSDEDQGDGHATEDEDDENDDGFEQDELHTSDSSGVSEEEDGGDTLGGEEEQATQATGAERNKRIRDGHADHPEKRPKLPRCGDCGSSPCVCATPRMQRLLQRIQHHGHG